MNEIEILALSCQAAYLPEVSLTATTTIALTGRDLVRHRTNLRQTTLEVQFFATTNMHMWEGPHIVQAQTQTTRGRKSLKRTQDQLGD